MLQLTQIDAQEIRVSVRIMDRIGSDYNTLGTYLLNDEHGDTMRTIQHDFKFTAKILDEVFHRWIKGQGQKDGKKMNTWETLVTCLKRSQLMALADEIQRVLHFCDEETLHMDDEECAREHMHEAPMEIKSFLKLQHLIPMLVTVVCVGAALCITLTDKHPTQVQQLTVRSDTDMETAALNFSQDGLGREELDSERKSIEEDCKDLTQEVQPGVREPEDAHPSTTEDPDAVPRLALAEESDNQQRQCRSDKEYKNKIQNSYTCMGTTQD